ncbi:MAG: glycosyl transferase family 1 [Chitinophagales bacterium]|nr:MAG: glycosyl transferase family 1 [Chitinophagales bacterium]
MPKVLRIINRLNLGGPTYNAAYLTRHLDKRYETMLLAGMRDETEASSEFILEKMGITPVYISGMYRSIHPANDWHAFRQIKRIIRQYQPDIVHTHAAKAGALGRMAAYQCAVPVIVHTFHGHVFHSYFNPVKTRLFIRIERYLARISTGIIAISNLQKQELSAIYRICKPDKISVIPLGFDLQRFQEDSEAKRKRFRQRFGLKDEEVAIGIVGRLVPVKNHTLFLRAARILLNQTQGHVRIFIVGDGEERPRLLQLATQLGMSYDLPQQERGSPLVFTSWIREIDEVMAGLDVVALTSHNEGTPVSLIEAQAAGRPVVSTAVGGIEDVVVPGKSAFLSPAGDITAFAENLLRLVNNPSLRQQMGSEGRRFVMGRFSFKRLVDDTTALYDRLLAEKGYGRM